MSRTVFIPHGGGPLPLIDEVTNKDLNLFLRDIGSNYQPDAIIVFSAHYETDDIEVIYEHDEKLVFDYYGFPKETYEYKYNPPINIKLGQTIIETLKKHDFSVTSSTRGFDHGVFVPLLLMYKDAHIPVIQISLHKSLDPAYHIRLGKALQELRNQNILFLGSGYSFHNLRELMRQQGNDDRNNQFHDWLQDVITGEYTEEERTNQLINWKEAPHAIYAHPRSEHFIPLHICYGINESKGKIIFDKEVYGKRTFGILWEQE